MCTHDWGSEMSQSTPSDAHLSRCLLTPIVVQPARPGVQMHGPEGPFSLESLRKQLHFRRREEVRIVQRDTHMGED